jgi:hypothetical protein
VFEMQDPRGGRRHRCATSFPDAFRPRRPEDPGFLGVDPLDHVRVDAELVADDHVAFFSRSVTTVKIATDAARLERRPSRGA